MNILDEKNFLFKQHETFLNTYSGSWIWDGKGDYNELLGGKYDYFIFAEDRAGNIRTSETKSIFVNK